MNKFSLVLLLLALMAGYVHADYAWQENFDPHQSDLG